MEPTIENGFVFFCSLAATCSTSVADCWRAHHLLSLAALALLVLFATALLHWAHPGGPAWGKLHHWAGTKSSPIPGPRGLPFVGSMGLMSSGLAHHHLASAAQSLNATRLMALSLGTTRVVITSDPDIAREILHGSSFADRPIKESAHRLMFHRAIGFAPYGSYWRALRRIATAHLFGPKQISASEAHRARIAAQMVRALATKGANNEGVEVRGVLKRASLMNVMGSVFGREYEVGCENEEMREMKGLVEEGYDLLGRLNWADHLPVLAGWDLQGVRFRCGRLVPKVNRFVMKIIEEHRVLNNEREMKGAADFVDVLLSLRRSERLSDSDMVAVLWEMIFRGTDSVAVLIEWTLARLTLHQDLQSKIHEELDRVVGRSRAVTGYDTASLTYLQAVLKEVLRVHPPGPLLSWARLATSDVHVDGKLVPAGTTAMVNMWAITHDPRVWKDPLEFRPGRFVVGPNEPEFPIFGSDLRLAPFGSGRRSCPGKALGMTTVSFWVATLLHEYKWVPTTRVDLSEVLRLSCEMAEPLTVKLVPRRR